MFENDYVMRLIKEIVRAILKLLFNMDTDSPTTEMIEDEEQKKTAEQLLRIIDNGNINEAENKIFDMAEDGGRANLQTALIFYSYLNKQTDEFLIQHDFSREEVMNGLKSIVKKYGLNGISEML